MKENQSLVCCFKQSKMQEKFSTMDINNPEKIINEEVTIVEFAYSIFQQIREKDNIFDEVIQDSLSPLNNRDAVFKAGES